MSFTNIHKASPDNDLNNICMFFKHKTISKPEKSSLSCTNQGKTMILPGANNGRQLVYSIVCNFNGIVLFKFSNICVKFKVDYPQSKIASICLKFLECQVCGSMHDDNVLAALGKSPHSIKLSMAYKMV